MSESRFPDFPRDEYGKRLRGENGRLICRGCKSEEVPPKRQTWCSLECKKKYDPYYIKNFVWERDNGTCQSCRLDLIEKEFKERAARHNEYCPSEPIEPETRHSYFNKAGHILGHYHCEVHFDHIIPHSEGGPTIAENMRVLCIPCHKTITAEWRRKKALERKGLQVLEFSS